MEITNLYENNGILYFANASSLNGDIDNPYVIWTLYPIAVWDYVDPDYSDKQYWVQQITDRGMFPNETYEWVQYIRHESIISCANDEKFHFLGTCKSVYFKDYINNPDDKAQKISVEEAVSNAMDML